MKKLEEYAHAAFMGVALCDLREARTIRERWKQKHRIERMMRNNIFHPDIHRLAELHLEAAKDKS